MAKKDNYFELVYEVTRLIPSGKVSTYGAIADYLALGSARMVGWALNKIQPGDEVPAHRVLNRKGELSGRRAFNPPISMEARLIAEGIVVKDNKVVNFEEVFWHPSNLDEIL